MLGLFKSPLTDVKKFFIFRLYYIIVIVSTKVQALTFFMLNKKKDGIKQNFASNPYIALLKFLC